MYVMQVLDNLGFHLSDEEKRVLYSRVDAKSSGMVYYNDFVLFMESPPSPRPLAIPHAEFDDDSLQAKGSNLLTDCAHRGLNISLVGRAFSHYDWKQTGKVPLNLFLRACRIAGLTYTMAELRQLSRHFSVGPAVGEDFPVAYRKFISWLTDEREAGGGGRSTSSSGGGGGGGHVVTMGEREGPSSAAAEVGLALLRDVKKGWVREGVDYRAAFERYDDELKGELTPSGERAGGSSSNISSSSSSSSPVIPLPTSTSTSTLI